jgi:hypothetical protein
LARQFYLSMIRLITFLLILGASLHAQDTIQSPKYRSLFFYNSGYLQYYPRLKPISVSRPDLLYRLPAIGNGLELIGVSKEFNNGMNSFGFSIGIESDEFFTSEGHLIPDPRFAPSNYYLSYFIDEVYETPLTRLYLSLELDHRIRLKENLDLVIGGFSRLEDRYPGHSRANHYPLTLEGYVPIAGRLTYGAKLGLVKNNWEVSLRLRKFYGPGYYTLTSLDNQIPGLNDTFEARQYNFAFQMRYYYGRKKHSYRYQ